MRRAEREIKDRAETDGIIRQSQVCRLGLVDGDTPYIVPLCFGYDGQALYFHCALQGRKIDALRRHPRVCFEFDTSEGLIKGVDACNCDICYQSVMGEGTAEILEDTAAKRRGLAVLMAQYGSSQVTEDAFPDAGLARTAVIRVAIESISAKQSPRK